MKFGDESFPTVAEIQQAVAEYVDREWAGQWPEDDWFDIGDHWCVNVWDDLGRHRIMVHPDRIGDDGMRTTDAFCGIELSEWGIFHWDTQRN
jgi:hypothetical protein